jgi:GTP-binding protein
VADALRRSQKPVILAANKVDNPTRELAMAEFYQFGIGDPLPVSAHHNQGIGVLLDEVVALLPYADDKGEQGGMRLAIVGRPNTGKSSLFNALVGEERVVVSEIPGTTRDSIDTRLEREGEGIVLVDTAGLRRRGKIQVGVEHFSALRAIRAIERANIALLLLDPGELGAAQDTHIAGYVLDAHKGLVLVVNKWDLGPDLDWSRVEVEEFLRARFKFAPYAPIVFTSAMKNTGLPNLLHVASKVHASRQQRVGTGELNRIVERAVAENLPRQVGRRRLHILYVTQSDIDPPTFVFFVNDPKLLHFSYRRYLENKIREIFDFEGTPLNFVFRRRGEG